MKMAKRCVLLLLAGCLASCASIQESRVNRLCGVGENGDTRVWTWLQTEPANAATYRAAAEAKGYRGPRGREREFWLTEPGGVTRLCIGDVTVPFACSGGWWDVHDTPEGPVSNDGNEWICVS